jgi:arylsulfatase A-like enzyme
VKRAVQGGLGGLAILLAVALAWWATRPTGPNVLLIVWDTTRADRMSLYGHERPTTPKLDARASRGQVYDRAWSASYWTLPSHGSLFTGLAASVHGADGRSRRLVDRHDTLAEQLSAVGYDTYLYTANPTLSASNLDQGFHTVEDRNTPAYREAIEAYNRAKLLPDDASTQISPAFTGPPMGKASIRKDAGPLAGRALLAWLNGRSGRWFAVVNYMEAHAPRVPSAASRAAVVPEELRARSLVTRNDARTIRALNDGTVTYTEEEREAVLAVYDATLRDLDEVTDSLLVELESQGLLENTLVVLTSDHGESFGEHGKHGHSYDLYEHLVRVPLVIWEPGQPGMRVPEAVANTAVYDLVRRFTGLSNQPSDLRALSGLAVTESTTGIQGQPRGHRAIREGDGKLIERDDDRELLFDLAVDPGETANIWPSAVDRRLRLEAKFAAWRAAQPEPIRPKRARKGDRAPDLAAELEALGYAE